MTEPTHGDGNAAAGAFADVLGFDVTTETLTCADCGCGAPFAESHVYHRAPGIVVRCRYCDHLLARLGQTPTDVWLDLHGAQSWRVPFVAVDARSIVTITSEDLDLRSPPGRCPNNAS